MNCGNGSTKNDSGNCSSSLNANCVTNCDWNVNDRWVAFFTPLIAEKNIGLPVKIYRCEINKITII